MAQEIDRPNPPPLPSGLPGFVLDLAVKLDIKDALTEKERRSIQKFRRAADYIAAAMIFLRSNILLQSGKLSPDDIKPRLLGHWGTCPTLVCINAHLNFLLVKHANDDPPLRMIYVVGPGHGAPGLLSSLWLEKSIERFYPNEYPRTVIGLENLVRGFSTPGGFPSHVNSETPGAIHEGGELGYALGVAYGSVLDKPDLISVVVVGDGESETGPTAASWHAHKFVDPRESGAVLPILHLNGFKISERTIPGTMDDAELLSLYTGYGYAVRIVGDPDNEDFIDDDLHASLEWALSEIRAIQKDARSGNSRTKPRWPMIILKTPKGWGGPKRLGGEIIEGNFNAHQVPLPKVKQDEEQRRILNDWLGSYKIHELIDPKSGQIDQEILDIIPKANKLGEIKETYDARIPLKVSDWKEFAVTGVDNHAGKNSRNDENNQRMRPEESSMKILGKFLGKIMEENPTTFRLFSPDELVSNKLDATLQVTSRVLQTDQYSKDQGGRIIEVLSEHICQALMQGYTLTGRTALFPSYESFLGIVHTMMVQYHKFIKMAAETKWRGDVSSINYVETSTWARQEHNGFSHQNPSFIGAVLNLKAENARVYLPPDANCMLSTMAHCLRSTNYVNLIVGSKQPTPIWLSPEEAELHCVAGASVFKFASTDDGLDPDVVLCGIGTETTFEVIAAASYLKKRIPELRVRVVNVTDLMVLEVPGAHPHALSEADFNALFTPDRRIHFNYHGYTKELQSLLFGRKNLERITIEGYREEGSTTTPADLLMLNHVSRYHVAIEAVRGASLFNKKVALEQTVIVAELNHKIAKHRQYIYEHGEDPAGTYDLDQVTF